jgi:hypothetical protein
MPESMTIICTGLTGLMCAVQLVQRGFKKDISEHNIAMNDMKYEAVIQAAHLLKTDEVIICDSPGDVTHPVLIII